MNRDLFLLTPTQLDSLWGSIRPLLNRAVSFGKGELEVDDIPLLVRENKMFVCAVIGDGVELAMALEPIYYPRKSVLSICYAGGKGVKMMVADQWHKLEEMARRLKCTEIQTMCRDSAARLFMQAHPQSRKVYNVLRVEVSNEA